VARPWLIRGPALLIVLVTSVRPVVAQPSQTMIGQTFPSVVMVVARDSDAQPLAVGSGFFVTPDLIATRRSLLAGATSVGIKPVGTDSIHTVMGLVAEDTEWNVALLAVRGLTAAPLTFADARDLYMGAPVTALGVPQGVEGVVERGVVSGVRRIGDLRVLQVTAALGPGLCGGPVIDEDGQVVGMSHAILDGAWSVALAIPGAQVKALLEKAGTPRPYPAVGDTLSLGLDRELREIKDGVEVTLVEYTRSGFAFSLQNNTMEEIGSVRVRVILYALESDEMVDFIDHLHGRLFGSSDPASVIPPGMARRVSVSFPRETWDVFTDYQSGTGFIYGRHEIRVLDWTVAR
jgi:hypothetical protein